MSMPTESFLSKSLNQEETTLNYHKASLTFLVLRWLVRGLLKMLFRIEVHGLENLPREGGYIFAGNHLSWMDPFLMLALAPAQPRVYFIAAREQMQASKFRSFMTERIGGVITVDRGQANAYRSIAGKVTQVLDGGGVLGIFPEGTVSETETGQLLPFKKGIGYFAAHSGVAVVPVAFSGTKEPWLRKHIVVVIGRPLSGQKGGKDVANQIIAQSAEAIQAILPVPSPIEPEGPKLLRHFFTHLFIKPEKES